MSYFNAAQHEKLLAPIKATRVGKDRNNRSHVEAYEIRAHLNRLIGFARWSQRVLVMELIFEQIGNDEKNGERVTVAYRAHVQLDVHAPDGTHLASYSEWATGDAANFPIKSRGDAHDFAIKTAESQGLKRCAMNLGDQFGLSLYRQGSVQALVGLTLVPPGGDTQPGEAADVDAHLTAPLPAESEESPDSRERNDPKPARQERTAKPDQAKHVEAFRTTALSGGVVSHQEWARLGLEVTRARLTKALTTDADGNPVTLGALIEACRKATAA